ncbi:uncharacterized protein LOC134539019 [Bacillus rossius redtenbacheri]|uniref:uncharacterized protein LOC134539019 n=1 Tax=Bacillus rossius redtenbacheri TaxID=93214 RepID=UPI002FDE3CD1
MNDVQQMLYLTFYILSVHMLHGISKCSTLWKLNTEEGKIVSTNQFPNLVSLPGMNLEHQSLEDEIFDIITSTVHHGKSWTKRSSDDYCTDCQSPNYNDQQGPANKTGAGADDRPEGEPPEPDGSEESLDCGRPANFTYYDSLVGVANRQSHPRVPEPHAALLFRKKGSKSSELDVDLLERRLKKTKREKPKSVQLYNQLGNFWRIKGNAHKSIECFRRALAVSPHNAEVLLNLARVLFNLQYLDDAIYLTRRSLEVQPPDKSAWQQYFTLGQIFKAYGHQQEAALHLRHALALKPDFEPAAEALKDVSSVADTTIHVYTVLIIVCLALGVLLIVLSSTDPALEPGCCEARTQRHSSRAAAVRGLKPGVSPRARRCAGGVSAICG